MVVLKPEHVIPKYELITQADLPTTRILKKSSSDFHGTKRKAKTGWFVAYDAENATAGQSSAAITTAALRDHRYHIPQKKKLSPATGTSYQPGAPSRNDSQ